MDIGGKGDSPAAVDVAEGGAGVPEITFVDQNDPGQIPLGGEGGAYTGDTGSDDYQVGLM